MPGIGSVSRWIRALKSGTDSAAQNIWDRYHARMHAVARADLGNSPRTVADEEDVVIRAFAAFLRRTRQGGYPMMRTRDDLWRLLATIIRSYAWQQCRFFGRLRRRTSNGGFQEPEEILRQLASGSPPPDVLATVSETLSVLLEHLDDPELQEVAMGRLHGLTNEEIAQNLNRSVRTIERRMDLIRHVWIRHIAGS